jgi:hypothetical protein
VEKVVAMPMTFAMGKVVKYGADLEGKHFSLTEDRISESLLAQITSAPDYTKGSVSRGRPDANGSFNLAEVDGATVHRMECKRLP